MPSPSGEARLWFGLPRPLLARILPFAVYILFLALQSTIEQLPLVADSGFDLRWLYAVRIAAVGSVLLFFLRDYTELRSGDSWRLSERLAALFAGALVFFLWISLDEGWVTLGSAKGGFVALDPNGSRDWLQIAVRIFGAAIVVPVMEELFWRSFLQRWIDNPLFLGFAPQETTLRALLMASVPFGFEHDQWLAGIIAGLAYGSLYKYTGRLWVPIVAHGVTNLLLGCWVVGSGQWHFW